VAPVADDPTLLSFYGVWDRVFHTAPMMGMAVAPLSAAGVAWRTGALPRWTSGLALLTAAVMLVDLTEDLATDCTHLGPLGPIGFGLACGWIIAISVWVLSTSGRRERASG